MSDGVAKLRRRIDELASRIAVRRATDLSAAQLHDAATVLSQSFHDHPLFVHAYPDPARRRRTTPVLFQAVLKDALRHGIVELAYDEGIAGVLIAYPPGAYPMSLARKARRAGDYVRVAASSPAGLARLMRIEQTLLPLHPAEPHYYAYFLGAAPGQLKCAGLILAKRLVDLAEHEGVPIYLEAQERSRAEMYAQIGGCTLLRDGVTSSPGGPVTWTLWHEAPARAAARLQSRAELAAS
jgi:hypothetical protein